MPDRPARVERSDSVGDRIFANGNDASGLGVVYGGATVVGWYPITLSSAIESFSSYCRKLRTDPENGQAKYAIVQLEDELAAIGMVNGASWNGARAFTATSHPAFRRCRSSSVWLTSGRSARRVG